MITILSKRSMMAEALRYVLSQRLNDQRVTIIDHDSVSIDRDETTTIMIVVSESERSAKEIKDAFAMGVSAYLISPSIDVLVKVIELVTTVGCNLVIGPSSTHLHLHHHVIEITHTPMIEITHEPPPPPLSPRELSILKHLSEGVSNKIIARRLCITESTAKVHVKAVLRKLRLSNRTQAAIWWQKRSVPPVPPPPLLNGASE